ncbi:MAG: PQQ-dependent sugar dehydrogenase [Chthoniobacterales bacterium]|nr:PQQ-dependent sugar dehydrogenase [Chthoniobacterales bacterium]
MKKFALLLLAGLSLSLPLHGATLPSGFTEQLVASGLSSPTAMAIAPDGRIFVCLQGGSLRVIKNGALLPTPFMTLTVNSTGERGLLGIAFDPDFATNQYLYVYYTNPSPLRNRISRFTANGDVVLAGSEVMLVELDALSASNHNGGAIHFGPDGKLYAAVGDNAVSSNSQSVNTRHGKMLRYNTNGTIPEDNPLSIPGIVGTPTGVNRAIWAAGLRNPFTFAFQPGSTRMFINDVGQSTWEEINDGIVGSNYGWPNCEGACGTPNPNFRDPILQYGRGSGTSTGCTVIGAAFYNPATNNFPNFYIGKYFYADYCSGWIRAYDPANGTSSLFATGLSFAVDLKVDKDGSFYYLERGNTGRLFRVTFNSTVAVQSAVSRKIHGAAGPFDIAQTGAAAIESRSGGATGDYTLVVSLTAAGALTVDGAPQAQVVSGTGTIGSNGVSNGGAVTVNGSTITIPLTNVANAQNLNVTLNSVNDGTTTRSFTIPFRVLIADTNNSAAVTAADVSQVKSASGQAADSTNFRLDINASGGVNATDVAIAKTFSGTALPPGRETERTAR